MCFKGPPTGGLKRQTFILSVLEARSPRSGVAGLRPLRSSGRGSFPPLPAPAGPRGPLACGWPFALGPRLYAAVSQCVWSSPSPVSLSLSLGRQSLDWGPTRRVQDALGLETLNYFCKAEVTGSGNEEPASSPTTDALCHSCLAPRAPRAPRARGRGLGPVSTRGARPRAQPMVL